VGISKNPPFPLQSICKMLIWRACFALARLLRFSERYRVRLKKKNEVFRDAYMLHIATLDIY
jgi:hypothetical protein